MIEFNIFCPAKEFCPKLNQFYHSCKEKRDPDICVNYVKTLKKLIPVYDCQRLYDRTPTKNYIVPAFWLCDSSKLWNYTKFLSELDFIEAQNLFSSPEFRSVLDGELAEGFYEMSYQRQKSIKK